MPAQPPIIPSIFGERGLQEVIKHGGLSQQKKDTLTLKCG